MADECVSFRSQGAENQLLLKVPMSLGPVITLTSHGVFCMGVQCRPAAPDAPQCMPDISDTGLDSTQQRSKVQSQSRIPHLRFFFLPPFLELVLVLVLLLAAAAAGGGGAASIGLATGAAFLFCRAGCLGISSASLRHRAVPAARILFRLRRSRCCITVKLASSQRKVHC